MKKVLLILIALLACGAVYAFFTKDSAGLIGAYSPTTSEIVVESPKPNEVVNLPIAVTGYIGGGKWYANEGEAGSVQVFDANGKAVSQKAPLRATGDWRKLPTYFSAQVGDRQMMSSLETDSGFLVLSSMGAKDGDVSQEFRVPVRFK